MKPYKILDFPLHSDPRGDLVPFEFDASFPFEVKRVYFVTGNPGEVRGGHAHTKEEEFFVMAHGSVIAKINDGTGDTIIKLDKKNEGLYVNNMCWHEFYDFSPDAVMVCFSSVHYTGVSEYILDKVAYLKQRTSS